MLFCVPDLAAAKLHFEEKPRTAMELTCEVLEKIAQHTSLVSIQRSPKAHSFKKQLLAFNLNYLEGGGVGGLKTTFATVYHPPAPSPSSVFKIEQTLVNRPPTPDISVNCLK